MVQIYTNNLEHINDELEKLDLLIQNAVHNLRRSQKKNDLPGLYISDEEIDSILLQDMEDDKTTEIPEEDFLCDRIQRHTELINSKVTESLKKGIPLQFPRLANTFRLSPFEMDAILICLAPELDIKYRRLYSYLQDDITKKHPTIALILNLLCLNFEEMIYARRLFASDSALMKGRLISFVKDPSNSRDHFPAQQLKMDNRIAEFLLGSMEIDTGIASCSFIIHPSGMSQDPVISEEIRSDIASLISSYLDGKSRKQLVFSFYGPDAEGKKQMAESICHSISLPLLVVDMNAIQNRNKDLEEPMCIIFREALLQQAAVYLYNIDSLCENEGRASLNIKILQDLFQEMGCVIFLSGNTPWSHSKFTEKQLFFEFEFPVLPYADRKHVWKFRLNGDFPLKDNVDLDALIGKFRFTRSQIHDAVLLARNRAYLRDGQNFRIGGDDLIAAARTCSNQGLLSFGRKIIPKYTWKDIILPRDSIFQLREICSHVTFNHKVYGEWGFDRKHSLGKGINILFSGVSGTGKTMAAEVLANELRLDLYKIDLSTVVSKYIGETEKNLSMIFKEAETSNAIIFFDEADALFGKRSEVKDSHDRYANIEINYLLQRMEEQEGIIILATNLAKNIDEAFIRRMHFSVSFPFPEKEQRALIWKGIFPQEVPLGEDIDFHFLAKQLNIPGGNIKNIALHSAFMAAEDGGIVGMKHIILATKREFQKTGRLCVEKDFKKYYELVS